MTTRRKLLVQAATLGGAVTASSAGTLVGATENNLTGGTSKSRNFVLVHGAFHGGWCYRRVADILRAHGHEVYTPTLTGLGERSHLAGLPINCSMHIQDVVNVIRWERLNEVILCGHSYGGIVIGGVADAIPQSIGAVVYLDCPLPENGKSVLDLVPQLQAPLFAATGGNGGFLFQPGAGAAKGFNVNTADQAMVDALLTPHPFASFCERLRLTGAYMRIAQKVYVRAKNYGFVVPAQVRDSPEWKFFETPSGHDIMIDAPAALADILLTTV